MDRFLLQRACDQQFDVQFLRRRENAIRRIALFIVDRGIGRQFQLRDSLLEFARGRRVAFPNMDHAQARSEACADTIRFRQDLVKARRKRGCDSDRPVRGNVQHLQLVWSRGSQGQTKVESELR